MERHWITIEGGGTRSTLSLINSSLEEIYTSEGPALHAQRLSFDAIRKRYRKLLEEGLEDCSHIKNINSIGLALAGADRKTDQQKLRKALSDMYPDMELFITSDVRATHMGAFEGDPGILVIAGTGSMVLGYNERCWERAGGYGWRLGDEGSGHQIGAEGLRAVGRDYDGQISTHLTRLLAEQIEINSREELIKWTYDEKHSPSRITPYVIQAAREGDSVCQTILKDQIDQLCKLIHSLTDTLNLPEGPISYHGGLFDSDFYRKEFLGHLHRISSAYHIQAPRKNPRIGLCIMMNNR